MFHTFQGFKGGDRSSQSFDADKDRGNNRGKPIKSLHACVECKRRKIRCDGNQPCQRCLSGRSQSRCVYDKHRQRVIPSRKTLEGLSQGFEECRSVLRRLYPNHDVSSLLPLSRQELLDLLEQPVGETSKTFPSPSLSTAEHPVDLEQMPTRNSEWDEERQDRDPLPAEADDVNALSLTMDKQASYLGASSIKAALMVMLQIQPQLRDSLASLPRSGREKAGNAPLFRQYLKSTKESSPIPWTWKGQTLVDAYFKRVHVFTPMLNEVAFRSDYLKGQRNDAPWLSLLNMVLAMGSIMATTSSDFNHIKYYNQAIEHLHLGAFGSSHIETVQALALLGGYYLHYINRPNMANAIIGGTIRMASALGLHRESLVQDRNDIAAAETRRRTWWTLFCIDTWTTTTLGRPSFGRCGASINIQPPKLRTDQEENDSAQHAGIMPLLENIEFCKIATQIQDMLAVAPLLKTEDRDHLDGLLVDWYDNLPWLLRTTEPCAEPLHLARSVMRWRYLNLRILLYRPLLLTLASKSQLPTTKEDTTALDLCQELVSRTVESISTEWMSHQMSGWNAVWFLYQAAMIPLINILWQPGSSSVTEWQKQIEKILELLGAMEEWSLTARRSQDVLRGIYEASHQLSDWTDDSSQRARSEQIGFGENDIHMSPIGPGIDDVVNMLDQDWLWDVQGLSWNQQAPLLVECDTFGVDGGITPVDYVSLEYG